MELSRKAISRIINCMEWVGLGLRREPFWKESSIEESFKEVPRRFKAMALSFIQVRKISIMKLMKRLSMKMITGRLPVGFTVIEQTAREERHFRIGLLVVIQEELLRVA